MNRKGETLAIFVLILPILLLFIGSIIEIGYITKEKIKLSNLTTTMLNHYYDSRFNTQTKEQIKNVFIQNNIPIENLKVTALENTFTIKNEYPIETFFGIFLETNTIKVHKQLKKVEKEYQVTTIKEEMK